ARMDVCALAGVAPRGPARVPWLDDGWTFDRPCVEPERRRRRSVAVPVESLDEYQRLFGDREGPGRLPHAVASFFQQGGRRAYIVRIVHDYGDPLQNSAGVARGPVRGGLTEAGPMTLDARNEGSWGNGLRAALGFQLEPLLFAVQSPLELLCDPLLAPPAGSLLRLAPPDGPAVLRWVATVVEPPHVRAGSASVRVVLDEPLEMPPALVELVEGVLLIDDGQGRRERHERLGLSRPHPRWLGTVLCYESELVYPHWSWVESRLQPPAAADLPLEAVLPDAGLPDAGLPDAGLLDAGLPDAGEFRFTGGEDREESITPDDFFDSRWVPGDPEPGDGVHALVYLEDLSVVLAPDLYSPEPLPDASQVEDPPPRVGADFVPCPQGESTEALPAATVAGPRSELPGLRLDPNLPAELDQIVAWQQRLVDLAELRRTFVVLLDVPPRLNRRRLHAWRSQFRSSYAAAYHPWPTVVDPLSGQLIRLNPSAPAAGIVARQALQFGPAQGPANVLVAGAVDVDQVVSPSEHDQLHPLGINVLLRERDGVRLTAARTLAADRRYRQLSVRRLLIMLRRVLEPQMHWMVFEPNGPPLWSDVRHVLGNYLRQLYQSGALRGETEQQAFFVRCDAALNPPRVVDAGQLVVEVGVAPAEPIEFLVLRLTIRGESAELSEVP
ncbi:MAG: phage tail sheath family protein, partial [Pirellulaceae bacterium]|nr:phage tail sheath family protein [Pirellulaceae bacterium]